MLLSCYSLLFFFILFCFSHFFFVSFYSSFSFLLFFFFFQKLLVRKFDVGYIVLFFLSSCLGFCFPLFLFSCFSFNCCFPLFFSFLHPFLFLLVFIMKKTETIHISWCWKRVKAICWSRKWAFDSFSSFLKLERN